jgi:large subunit ribosomal protein L16
MLAPKKTKHRKGQKGRSRKRSVETRGTQLHFGSYGLQAMSMAYVDSKQLEAGRKAITHLTKRGGKMWIRIFPDKPISQRPPELTMGGGKGAVDHYAFPVKPGRILYEVDGLPEKVAMDALRRAAFKMPVKCRIIKK